MASYNAILTNLGLAKIAAALADNSTINLTTMVIGDGAGNDVVLSPARTTLVRQVSSTPLYSLSYNPDRPTQATAQAFISEESGGYTIREFGILDDAGELIVIGSTPAIYKPTADVDGTTIQTILRVVFDVGNSSAVSITLDPNILLATRDWVQDNFSLSILLPGGTTGQVLRKRSNADGDVEWYDPTTGINVTVDVISETQSLASGQKVINLAIAGTEGAAVYLDRDGNGGVRLRGDGDQWAATSENRITLTAAASGGEKITIVQNEPTDSSTYLRRRNALSEIAEDGSVSQANARANLGLGVNQEGYNDIKNAVLQSIYPISCVKISTSDINPASYLGFGTWQLYGQGRALVGVNTNDPDFREGVTGGEKTHTLSSDEMPSHKHSTPSQKATSTANGSHTHSYRDRYWAEKNIMPYASRKEAMPTNYNGKYGSSATDRDNSYFLYYDGTTGSAPNHTHDVTIPSSETGSAGGGKAHNNMPPYVTVYVWRRTA
jgi:microcystin-dependent protein